MAVQKSKRSRSKKGMSNAHRALSAPALSIDAATGETHRRHHVSPDGYYKGRQIIKKAVATEEDTNEE